jgi:riboflavin kinase/FMN adenylyltransferase
MLAKPFSLRGEIVSGHGIGSRQTVPTLNLSPETKLRPAQGVYVTCTSDLESGRRWRSVTNVGSRPTFNGTDQTVETYLIEELQGRQPARIELAFLHRLRDEAKFETPEKLRRQILKDVEQAKRYFRLLDAAERPHQPAQI